MDKSEIAIFISFGSLFVSLVGVIYSIYNSQKARRLERIRVYDKVYHDVSELLLYSGKRNLNQSYVCNDKLLEKAVNDYESSHWIEQVYGLNIDYPECVKSIEDKLAYREKVAAEHRSYKEKCLDSFNEAIANRSPVFNLENHDYAECFYRIVDLVKDNLSYFSVPVVECFEKMRLLSPETVRNDYVALRRVEKLACDPIGEPIDDPYLKMLLYIRDEYREMNKSLKKKSIDLLYNFGYIGYCLNRIFDKRI